MRSGGFECQGKDGKCDETFLTTDTMGPDNDRSDPQDCGDRCSN